MHNHHARELPSNELLTRNLWYLFAHLPWRASLNFRFKNKQGGSCQTAILMPQYKGKTSPRGVIFSMTPLVASDKRKRKKLNLSGISPPFHGTLSYGTGCACFNTIGKASSLASIFFFCCWHFSHIICTWHSFPSYILKHTSSFSIICINNIIRPLPHPHPIINPQMVVYNQSQSMLDQPICYCVSFSNCVRVLSNWLLAFQASGVLPGGAFYEAVGEEHGGPMTVSCSTGGAGGRTVHTNCSLQAVKSRRM